MATEIRPIEAAVEGLERRLIDVIDALLSFPPKGLRLTRRRRDGLTAALLERVEQAMRNGPDPALEALYDRYSKISFEDRREFEQGMKLAFAEQMVSEVLGADFVDEHAAESAEELFARASERFEAEQRQRDAEKAARQESRRESAAQARRAEEQLAVGHSVRAVYRKLVSSLHPDRETDPDELKRKTNLMKEINRAYQANDLLTLLNLQMQVEQIDATTLAALPVERLRHYNEVLREQLRALNDEIAERVHQLMWQLGERGRPMRDPREVETRLKYQLSRLVIDRELLELSIARLQSDWARAAEIDALIEMLDWE